ncbi:odorant receptor 94a-like [Battus philenor]|uniref:odorant receptor 94a-like n=1 Tax=Battus philenor TaxID=42288 RepID=UPI0035D0FC84
MTFIARLWNKLTYNKALEESSGKFETMFYEAVYRIIYITGLSTVETGAGYFIYSSIIKLMITLFICSELWYFIYIAKNIDTIVESINAILIQFASLIKNARRITHRDRFKHFASAMESPNFDISTQARRQLVDVWEKRNTAYLKFFLLLGTCTLAFWYSYPFMDDIDYNLMVAVYLPFDYSNSSTYPIAYVMIVIVFTYVSYFVIVNDLLMQTYVMHLLCQISVLQDCFNNILNECVEDFKGVNEGELLSSERFRVKFHNRLRDLINQHRFITNNTLELRKILSLPLLGHMATSTVLICSIGYQIVLSVSANISKSLMSLLYLGYNMIILYNFCRWCEELTIQSEGIGARVYCLGWERGLATIPGVRSSLLIILTRTNKPVILTAGGMYDLSLDSYANLIKTSYSAFTMLLRFRRG